jgi:hypothetical protein
MILLAEITAFTVRSKPIYTGYCPDWKASSEDTLWGARVLLEQELLSLGETCQGVLYPMTSNAWTEVKIGDIIVGQEGSKQTLSAKILNVFKDRQ